MIKIKTYNGSDINDELAVWLVGEVIKAGRLSDDGAAYCAVTTFTAANGEKITVYADRTPAGVDSFKIWKQS